MTLNKEQFKAKCDNLRSILKVIGADVYELKEALQFQPAFEEGQNRNEMIANLTLAFRHTEDAAMRIGKAIQASEGGESPLGGPSTPKS